MADHPLRSPAGPVHRHDFRNILARSGEDSYGMEHMTTQCECGATAQETHRDGQELEDRRRIIWEPHHG